MVKTLYINMCYLLKSSLTRDDAQLRLVNFEGEKTEQKGNPRMSFIFSKAFDDSPSDRDEQSK